MDAGALNIRGSLVSALPDPVENRESGVEMQDRLHPCTVLFAVKADTD